MWWGAEVAHDEGTSSCVVPVRSRSKSLVCSWEATLSVFTLNSTGPSWSSVPTKLKCSWNQTDDNKRWVMYARIFRPWPWPGHSNNYYVWFSKSIVSGRMDGQVAYLNHHNILYTYIKQLAIKMWTNELERKKYIHI